MVHKALTHLVDHYRGVGSLQPGDKVSIRPIVTSGGAQSVPKRSGTSRLLLARSGTKGHCREYANCLTSPLFRTDKAVANVGDESSV